MSDCERLQPTFEAYVAGELDETAVGPLLVHCRSCKDCRELLELHRDLAVLASRAPDLAAAELDELRGRVLRGIPESARASRGRFWTARIPRAAAALAASVVLFVAGWATGRIPRSGAGGMETLPDPLIGAIRADAASNRDLADVENSPFIYSNVSLRPLDAGRVALEFDVTTHVRLDEPLRSDLVRDVLAQSLLSPSNPGARLRAVALAGAGSLEPKVKEALLFALRRDGSLAVRMEALAILSGRLDDAEVRTAVLDALRDDESVQMRLLALDALAAASVDRGRIRETIRDNTRPGAEALLVRLAEIEKQL